MAHMLHTFDLSSPEYLLFLPHMAFTATPTNFIVPPTHGRLMHICGKPGRRLNVMTFCFKPNQLLTCFTGIRCPPTFLLHCRCVFILSPGSSTQRVTTRKWVTTLSIKLWRSRPPLQLLDICLEQSTLDSLPIHVQYLMLLLPGLLSIGSFWSLLFCKRMTMMKKEAEDIRWTGKCS